MTTLVVERFVGRTQALTRAQETAETTDRTVECARDGPGCREVLPPKEVAQVRILPGALANPQVTPYFASSSGLHLDHLLARCWQTRP